MKQKRGEIMKKLFLFIIAVFMFTACSTTAEKEKNDLEIIDGKVFKIERNTRDELSKIIDDIFYEKQNISVEKLDEAINNTKKHLNTCIEQLENELKNIKSSAGKEIVEKKIKYFTLTGDVFIQILSELKNHTDISGKELEDKASEILESKFASKVEEVDKFYSEIEKLISELKERISNNQKKDTK